MTHHTAAQVTLGPGHRVRIGDLVAVARDRATIALTADVEPRLAAARTIVEAQTARGAPVYGLTTGLGAAVDTALAPADIAAFQTRAIEARAVAVGPYLSVEAVRATLFARLAGLAQGASGITPGLVRTIRDMLNRGVHPLARETGSLGQADLAILAELFLPFAGAGVAIYEDETLPGIAALHRAGITPARLGPKDGIGLINASSYSVGMAALAIHDLRLALDALTVAGALSLEAFRANLSPLDPRLVALRPAPGQAAMSAHLLTLLDGGDLAEPGRARRLQDPLSFRCLAPVHGWASLRLADAAEAVEADLSGAGDSPAVLVEDGAMLSSVGFDTTAIALSLEALGQAAAHCAAPSVFRVVKLMSPAVSDLPRFLTRRGGSRAGYATAAKTAAALEAEIRRLALPYGPMTAPVADGIEDYAPMTPRIACKTGDIAASLARLAAVELTVAAAAIDLREGIRLGAGTGGAYRFVRDHAPAFDDDRPTGGEFEALAGAIEAGELESAMGERVA